MRRLLFVAALLVGLSMAAISFAAGEKLTVPPARVSRLPATMETLVVPDVRHEAFVFAKGQLQDDGFAWKVAAGSQGYPANLVVSQSPAPGTRVIDTGAPLTTVTVARNKEYGTNGEPENTSPYTATAIRMAS
jgi:hypothetical protein